MPTKPLTRQQILLIYKTVFLTRFLREIIEIIPKPNDQHSAILLQQWQIIAVIVPPPENMSKLLKVWKEPAKVIKQQQQPSSASSSSSTSLPVQDGRSQLKERFGDFTDTELNKILEAIQVISVNVESLFSSSERNKQTEPLIAGNSQQTGECSDKKIKLELFMQVLNELIGELPLGKSKGKVEESLSGKEALLITGSTILLLLHDLVSDLGLFIIKKLCVPQKVTSSSTTTAISLSHSHAPTQIASLASSSSSSSTIIPSLSPAPTQITSPSPSDSKISWCGLGLNGGIEREQLSMGLRNIFKIVTILDNTHNYLDDSQVRDVHKNEITSYMQQMAGSLRDACVCIAQTEENVLPIFDFIWNRYAPVFWENRLLAKYPQLTHLNITKPNISAIFYCLNTLCNTFFSKNDTNPCQFVQCITEYINKTSFLKTAHLSSLPNPLKGLMEVAKPYKENSVNQDSSRQLNKILQFYVIQLLPTNIEIIKTWRAEILIRATLLLKMGNVLARTSGDLLPSLEMITNELLHLAHVVEAHNRDETIGLIYDFHRIIFGDQPVNRLKQLDVLQLAEIQHISPRNLLRLKIHNNILDCCVALTSYNQGLAEGRGPSGLSTPSPSTLNSSRVLSSSSMTFSIEQWSRQIREKNTLVMNTITTCPVNIPTSTQLVKEVDKLYGFLNDRFLTNFTPPPYEEGAPEKLIKTNKFMLKISDFLEKLTQNMQSLNKESLYILSQKNPFDEVCPKDVTREEILRIHDFGKAIITRLQIVFKTWQDKKDELIHQAVRLFDLKIANIPLSQTGISFNVGPSIRYEAEIAEIKSLLEIIIPHFVIQSSDQRQSNERQLSLVSLEKQLLMFMRITQSENNQNPELEAKVISLLEYFYSSLLDGHPLKKEAPKISNSARTINSSSAVTPMPSSSPSPVSSRSLSSSSSTPKPQESESPTDSPTDTPRPDSRHKVVSPSALIGQQPPSITSSSTSSVLSAASASITTSSAVCFRPRR
ncbi:MAG: hypothetical protein A2X78_02635 [Gammaproteobacteria bacterium GWE2_37_16]|nr:MAG: hypothetical protein A2X78_02635 [Gammaproteobacteria bacterium GWE2_37_16]